MFVKTSTTTQVVFIAVLSEVSISLDTVGKSFLYQLMTYPLMPCIIFHFEVKASLGSPLCVDDL